MYYKLLQVVITIIRCVGDCDKSIGEKQELVNMDLYKIPQNMIIVKHQYRNLGVFCRNNVLDSSLVKKLIKKFQETGSVFNVGTHRQQAIVKMKGFHTQIGQTQINRCALFIVKINKPGYRFSRVHPRLRCAGSDSRRCGRYFGKSIQWKI